MSSRPSPEPPESLEDGHGPLRPHSQASQNRSFPPRESFARQDEAAAAAEQRASAAPRPAADPWVSADEGQIRQFWGVSSRQSSNLGFNAMPPSPRRPAKSVSGSSEEQPLLRGGRQDASRWIATIEAAVARMFWDGFVWEYVDLYSVRHLGLTTRSPLFFLYTGLGAALGCFVGNFGQLLVVYGCCAAGHRAANQPLPGHSLLLAGFQFSLFLSLANFCSAYAWQPLTNALTAFAHASPFPDDQNGAFFLVLFSLWVLDAAVYFCGAQLARLLLVSWPLRWSAIEPAGTVSSLLYDGTLAWSVGACAGSFYCVDAPNPLTRAFDVKRKTTILQGAVLGGLSNTMGFLFAQALQKCVCLACISHDALALTL